MPEPVETTAEASARLIRYARVRDLAEAMLHELEFGVAPFLAGCATPGAAAVLARVQALLRQAKGEGT